MVSLFIEIKLFFAGSELHAKFDEFMGMLRGSNWGKCQRINNNNNREEIYKKQFSGLHLPEAQTGNYDLKIHNRKICHKVRFSGLRCPAEHLLGKTPLWATCDFRLQYHKWPLAGLLAIGSPVSTSYKTATTVYHFVQFEVYN